ncbi:MMPL family transporter [Janibacter sp. G1551]|uniref:MMPL family transporter n=1 Tax=Janibacter sp. G1551 TaxID=3420440 RepID=UPI003D030EED
MRLWSCCSACSSPPASSGPCAGSRRRAPSAPCRPARSRHEDHHHALAVATRGSVGAIVASNLTVVLALLTLVLTAMPSTRGLGLAGAAGLLVALVTVLTLLPAALALVGRKAFWPYVPRVGEAANSGSVWRRAASVVTARPAVAAAASVVVLGALAAGLLGTKVGLSQTDQFRVASESAAGLGGVSRHLFVGGGEPPPGLPWRLGVGRRTQCPPQPLRGRGGAAPDGPDPRRRRGRRA